MTLQLYTIQVWVLIWLQLAVASLNALSSVFKKKKKKRIFFLYIYIPYSFIVEDDLTHKTICHIC